MDHFQRLQRQIQRHVLIVLISTNVTIMLAWWVFLHFFHLDLVLVGTVAITLAVIMGYVYSHALTAYVTDPLKILWQAILHVSPEHHGTAAPNLEKARVGRELVTTLALQVYQLASSGKSPVMATQNRVPETTAGQGEAVVQNLPIPVIVIDREQKIVFANGAASTYLEVPAQEIIGQPMYSVLDFAFPSDSTFDEWLTSCRQDKVTDTHSWERVRLETKASTRKQFDMVAYYNKNNPSNVETIVGLFDQTNKYSQDDASMGFVALAIHELRTPLTMLRGYIEVLEEELGDKLDPELDGFMKKMQASAQQLASFVTNILNVARVEENQLFLQLKEETWPNILRGTLQAMSLRAQVHGKQIVLQIQPDLPAAAVDQITISEVITNLVDNAIKYSGDSSRIVVKTYLGNDGFIETTVQDFGIGIPENIMGNLFEKFYRNHRSRTQVGGTGLGLFLSKSIVTAHGGQIWVNSKEGEGSTFGFSLQPYSKLAEGSQNADNKEDVTRTAHGWIKNHSFYRR